MYWKENLKSERIQQIIQTELDAINGLKFEGIDEVVELITSSSGKVIFTGMGKAGLVARKIAATLSSTGTPSVFIHPGEAQHGDLGVISDNDIIIAMSNSGKTEEVLLTLKLCKRTFPCKIIGITASKESEMSSLCDYTLEIGKIKEACPFGLAPTASTTAMIVLGDVLSILVMEKKAFTKEEYSKRHHGGYIGLLTRS
jgi:arabinose-5-phosphate isomerase